MTNTKELFAEWMNDTMPWAVNFSPSEITRFADNSRNGVHNTMPPAALWPNIINTMKALQCLRTYTGMPVTITSAYRSPEYNAQFNGSSSKSQHIQFRAIDFTIARVQPAASDILLDWRRAGWWTGGLGIYNTFIHIDTRSTNADWDKRT